MPNTRMLACEKTPITKSGHRKKNNIINVDWLIPHNGRTTRQHRTRTHLTVTDSVRVGPALLRQHDAITQALTKRLFMDNNLSLYNFLVNRGAI